MSDVTETHVDAGAEVAIPKKRGRPSTKGNGHKVAEATKKAVKTASATRKAKKKIKSTFIPVVTSTFDPRTLTVEQLRQCVDYWQEVVGK